MTILSLLSEITVKCPDAGNGTLAVFSEFKLESARFAREFQIRKRVKFYFNPDALQMLQ